MSPRRTSTGPAAYRAALALAAGVVVVRSVLLALDGVRAAAGPGGHRPAVPGARRAARAAARPLRAGGRRPAGSWCAATTVPGRPPTTAPSSRRGSRGRARPTTTSAWPLPACSACSWRSRARAARFPELEGFRLHLHVPDDTGRLVPVLEHDDPDRAWSRGWDPGSGVVGRAFLRRRVQAGRGEAPCGPRSPRSPTSRTPPSPGCRPCWPCRCSTRPAARSAC